jgi:hypothetical protein
MQKKIFWVELKMGHPTLVWKKLGSLPKGVLKIIRNTTNYHKSQDHISTIIWIKGTSHIIVKFQTAESKEFIKDYFGDGAADTWMEGDIVYQGGELTLDFVKFHKHL